MKEAWKKPELIVMVRSKPEEAVLGTCKGTNGAAGPLAGACVGTGGGAFCDVTANS